jgi:hypothetical protein
LAGGDRQDIYPVIEGGLAMAGPAQKKAVSAYRQRLARRGVARFEVLGRETDRDLIRSVARRLASEGPEASALRDAIRRTITQEPAKKGGVLAALRRSPLVGADLVFKRSRTEGRDVSV